MKRSLSLIAVFLAFRGVLFAEHPNDSHGFSADHVYSVHDVDTVNAFNGNMIIRIPIGPEYKVNGLLPYRLSLTYNSHLWHFVDNTSAFDTTDNIVATPPGTDNAGLGWRLSLGKLYDQGDPDSISNTSWVYQSGDGADHQFYDTLTSDASTPTVSPQFTRDSSYIRLTSIDGTTKHVEFPDGTVHTFRQLLRGSWQTSATSHEWFLTSISDASGNTVSIAYSSAGFFSEIWTISDGARSTSVYFRIGLTSDFTSTLDHVDLPAAGGGTLSYSFAIQNLDVTPPSGDTSGRAHITVPVLTAVTPSVGNGYNMTLGGAPAYESSSRLTSGVLTRLVLPTLGAVGWIYDQIRFGRNSAHRSPAIEIPTGVTARTTYDPAGSALGTWTYLRINSAAELCTVDVCGNVNPPCSSGRPRQITVLITDPPTTPDNVQKTTINYFSNYESIDDPNGETCPAPGWVSAEHGLPFTRYAMSNQRFLSSEVRTGFSPSDPAMTTWDGRGQVPTAAGVRLRTTYVTYQLDSDAASVDNPFERNGRLSSTATFYGDHTDQSGDNHCGPTGNDACFTAANYLAFDGFGHFRQTSTDGNLPGTGNYRTSFTNYNAAPTSSSWLLTTFTEQCTADEAGVRTSGMNGCSELPGAFISRMQFDSTGRLIARRTHLQSGGAPDIHDLLATFTYDGNGNLSTEQYYGGDMQALDGTAEFAIPSSSPYAINHALTYSSSGGALLRDTATYGGSGGITVSDETYDQSTGLVTDVRDVSGLLTHYTYDPLGRITGVQPPGVAPATYTYSDASFANSIFTPAKVLADSSSSGLGSIRKEYQYDPFGRLWRQKSLLDDGVTWSIVQSEFDVLGRKSASSMPEKLLVSESSFVPAHTTKYHAYDAFDRATNIEGPDGNATSFVFTGIRSVQRTVNIATTSSGCTPSNPSGCTPATTEEIHDAAGRLYQVTEPSGPTTLSAPVGAPVTTTYTYDSGAHLTGVSTPPQTRTFTYDHRGFLTSEQHPEVGVNGNGLNQYMGYDARGHAHGKLTAAINGILDLRYTYDNSERLTAVTDSGDSLRPLKEYTYWPNDPANNGSGKLQQAIRHNHPVSFPGEVVVTETYTYATPSGRISKRDTLVESVNGSRTTLQTFTQNATYDQLGSLAQIDYPVCGVACTNSPSSVGPAYTRRNGFLTGVAGYASPITYNADGSIFEITHDAAHGIKDTYTPDSSGMGRPGVINFAGATSCTASAAVSGDSSITSGQTATISATFTGGSQAPSSAAPWSITWSDGVTESATHSPWTRNVTPTLTTHYTITSVSDGSCVGSSNGMATVTVQSCNASVVVSGNASITAGQTATIVATLSGGTPPTVSAPWSITWSDGVTESATQSTWTRNVTPLTSTTYSVTSFTAGAGCSGAGTGQASITVTSLPTPAAMTATAITNTTTHTTLTVSLQWSPVQGAAWYQVERATHLLPSADWQTLGGHVTSLSINDPFGSTNPTTYLYRVRAGVTSGGTDASSGPSPIDYATVATNLFSDEPLVPGATTIKGIHIGELRQAIDAVRRAAGLNAAWSSYAAATGPVTASDNITARQRLDEATIALIGHGVAYTGEVPTPNGRIWAIQLQQIRDGVR
jgi:YD repeat-containing protein